MAFIGTGPNLTQLNASNISSGTLAVANGGTGLTSVGTNGQVLSSNGSAIVWTTPSGGTVTLETFTTSGTWNKPSTGTLATIICVGGGGGGGRLENSNGGQGSGGLISLDTFRLSDLPSTVAVTIGAGGAGSTSNTAAGANGGETTFGSFVIGIGGSGGQTFTSNTEYNPAVVQLTSMYSNLGLLLSGLASRRATALPSSGWGLNEALVRSPIFPANGGSGQHGLNSQYVGGNVQNIFGTGGTGGNGTAGGNATGNGGGGGGAAVNTNGGNGSPGLCKVFVY